MVGSAGPEAEAVLGWTELGCAAMRVQSKGCSLEDSGQCPLNRVQTCPEPDAVVLNTWKHPWVKKRSGVPSTHPPTHGLPVAKATS